MYNDCLMESHIYTHTNLYVYIHIYILHQAYHGGRCFDFSFVLLQRSLRHNRKSTVASFGDIVRRVRWFSFKRADFSKVCVKIHWQNDNASFRSECLRIYTHIALHTCMLPYLLTLIYMRSSLLHHVRLPSHDAWQPYENKHQQKWQKREKENNKLTEMLFLAWKIQLVSE